MALLASTVVAGGWPRPRPLALAPRPRRIDRRRGADGAADRTDRFRPGQLRTAVDASRCPHRRPDQRRQRRQRPRLAGWLDVLLRNTGPAPIRVDLRVDRASVIEASVLEPGAERRLEWRGLRTGLLFVEVASRALDGQPAPLDVRNRSAVAVAHGSIDWVNFQLPIPNSQIVRPGQQKRLGVGRLGVVGSW